MTGKTACRKCFRKIAQGAVFLMLALCLLCSGGCAQRELCYDHSHVSPVFVEFDWSMAPDAAPATMVVWFFSETSEECYRFELSNGGTASRSQFDSHIKVRPGTYRVLCHNGSTDNNSEAGDTFEEYRITTYDAGILSPMNRSDKAPLPVGAEAQAVKASPSTVYADALDRHIVIEPAADSETHIRFVPVEVTATYDIVITGVENLIPGTDVSAVLTGMAEAWNPANYRPAGADVTIPFALDQDGPDTLRGSLLTFGDNAPHDVRHILRVYASYNYYDFDVTDQIHNATDSRHVEIQLHGLKLPAPEQGGGMSPGVEGWENAENIVITM